MRTDVQWAECWRPPRTVRSQACLAENISHDYLPHELLIPHGKSPMRILLSKVARQRLVSHHFPHPVWRALSREFPVTRASPLSTRPSVIADSTLCSMNIVTVFSLRKSWFTPQFHRHRYEIWTTHCSEISWNYKMSWKIGELRQITVPKIGCFENLLKLETLVVWRVSLTS